MIKIYMVVALLSKTVFGLCQAQPDAIIQPYLSAVFANNADTIQQWYSRHFGFTIKDHKKDMAEPNSNFFVLEKDGFLLEIVQWPSKVFNTKSVKDTMKTYQHFSGFFKIGFHVNNIREWYNRLKSEGVKMESENVTTGKNDLYILCSDPEGNLLQLFQKQNSANSETDSDTIKNIIQQTAKAINEKNADGIMAHYSKDILVSYPGIPDTKYDEFYESYRQMLKPNADVTTFTVPVIDEILVSGDLAAVRMTWETTITETALKKTEVRKAKDLQIWKRENGSWKFIRGMWYRLKQNASN